MNKKLLLILSPVLLIVVWFIAAHFEIVNALFLPTPHIVLYKLIELLITTQENLTIWPDMFFTLCRMLISFSIAIIIGIPLGLLMGYFDKIYYSLEFIVDFFRSVPATAMFPLFMLFFGIGNKSKIAITAFACSLIILVNTMYGVKHSGKLRIIAAKTLKTNNFQLFTKVIFPSALPNIFAGLRTAISLSLILIIVTEMFAGTIHGLGHRILNAQLVYRIPEMYSAIILAGILGFLINSIFIKIEKRIIHWTNR